MAKPAESLSAQDIEALESAPEVEAAEDVDIDQWLGQQTEAAKKTGEVVIDGKRIKIAVVDEGEENRLIKQARRPDPRNPKEMRVDMMVYRRAYVALSLTKANGKAIIPDALLGLAPGTLTKLQTEIQKLSQYDLPERRTDPFDFLA